MNARVRWFSFVFVALGSVGVAAEPTVDLGSNKPYRSKFKQVPKTEAVSELPTTHIRLASEEVPVTSTPTVAPFTSVLADNPARSSVGGWNSGVGLLFLSPYIGNNTAFTVVTPPAPPVGAGIPVSTASARSVSFAHGTDLAWKAWLGWASESGWGVQFSFMSFGTATDYRTTTNAPPPLDPLNPIPPTVFSVPTIIPPIDGVAAFGSPSVLLAAGLGMDRLVFESQLLVRNYDVGVTREVALGDTFLSIIGGVRIGTIQQKYSASLVNRGVAGTSETQLLTFDQDFAGGGPLVGLLLRQQLFGSGLAFVGQVRGAILFGHQNQRADFFQNITDPALLALAGSQQTRTRYDNRMQQVIPVADIELGLEYGLDVGRSRLFFRGSAVSQSYFNSSNSTGSSGAIHLLGGQLAAGVNY